MFVYVHVSVGEGKGAGKGKRGGGPCCVLVQQYVKPDMAFIFCFSVNMCIVFAYIWGPRSGS